MTIYNLSIAAIHHGGAFMAQAAAEPAAQVKLTAFERDEIRSYLQEWAGDPPAPGLSATTRAVELAIDKLADQARAVTVRADGPLPDLTPWLIDVRRSDLPPGGLTPLMARQLAHWRAGNEDREEAYQAIIKKIETGIPEFMVRYEGALPNFSAWGITIRSPQAAARAGVRVLNSRAVASAPALAPRTIGSVRDLIRDMPQAALWAGTPSAWSERCMQVFGQATDAIDKLDAATSVKLDLLKTLHDTFNDRLFKYAAQDESVLREAVTVAQDIAPEHLKFRERLQVYQPLTDWRAGHPGREEAYQKILRAIRLRAKHVTVICDGEPPKLWRLGIEVRRHSLEAKGEELNVPGAIG